MATFTKSLLSESTNGLLIDTTSGAGIHKAVTGTTSIDEVWLWATNISVNSVQFTLTWGTGTGGLTVIINVPPQDYPTLIVPGWCLNNAQVISGSGAVYVGGFINRVAP